MKLLFRIMTTMVLPLGIFGGAAFGAYLMLTTSPETERTSEERHAPVVEVIRIAKDAMPRIVEGNGTVRPAQEVTVSMQVSGRVVEMHPALQPGGIIRQGEVIVKLDPEEYELALDRAEAARQETVAALQVEQGRQRVAEREWELFGKDLPDAELGRELMLREPQMEQARARIASAESEVARAKLDLKRTELRAPFDALVRDEVVDLGQQVSANDNIATLIGTSAFWIQVSVPSDQLGAVLDAVENESCEVRIYDDGGHNQPLFITEGELVRHLGQVDPEGRMAQVLVEANDPLGLNPDAPNHPPLPLNSYVTVQIDAGIVEDAVPIPLVGLRENNQIWIADADNLLEVRDVEIMWAQGDQVAVADNFDAGDRLIVSPLENALPGMEVRTIEPDDPALAATTETPAA